MCEAIQFLPLSVFCVLESHLLSVWYSQKMSVWLRGKWACEPSFVQGTKEEGWLVVGSKMRGGSLLSSKGFLFPFSLSIVNSLKRPPFPSAERKHQREWCGGVFPCEHWLTLQRWGVHRRFSHVEHDLAAWLWMLSSLGKCSYIFRQAALLRSQISSSPS